jgi:hypothetical protein
VVVEVEPDVLVIPLHDVCLMPRATPHLRAENHSAQQQGTFLLGGKYSQVLVVDVLRWLFLVGNNASATFTPIFPRFKFRIKAPVR